MISTSLLAFIILIPGLSFAQRGGGTNNPPPPTPTTNTPPSTTPPASNTPSTSSMQFAKLPNPLGGAGINTTGDAVDKIMEVVMIVAIPFVTIMIMYAGFSYITAYGNPEKIKAANKRALWTLIGTILLFGATTIGSLIIKTIQNVTTSNIPAQTPPPDPNLVVDPSQSQGTNTPPIDPGTNTNSTTQTTTTNQTTNTSLVFPMTYKTTKKVYKLDKIADEVGYAEIYIYDSETGDFITRYGPASTNIEQLLKETKMYLDSL